MSSCRDGWPIRRDTVYTKSYMRPCLVIKEYCTLQWDWISTWAQAALNLKALIDPHIPMVPKVYVVGIISKSFTRDFYHMSILYRLNRVDVWNYMDLLQQHQLVQQPIESPTVPHCLFRMETDLRLHQVLLFLMRLCAPGSSIRLSGGCGVRCESLVIILATCIHFIAIWCGGWYNL